MIHSLYCALTEQHRDEFAPMRCNQETISRLVRCFEDVVIENKLSGVVIEGKCLKGEPSRENKRLSQLIAASRRVYLFTCNEECEARTYKPDPFPRLSTVPERDYHGVETGPFILVIEPRFSGLLASCVLPDWGNSNTPRYEMVWTFDPNVVFTAIEYLMARLSAESPQERDRLEMLLRASTPRTSSVRLALSFTTKVTMLMQRQNELEMATNRISSAISNTLETEPMLQSAVEEVGRVLNARRAAIVLWQEGSNLPEGMTVYERPQESQGYADEVKSLISTSERGASNGPQNETDHISQAAEQHGLSVTSEKNAGMTGPLEVPISYQNNVIGVLVVEDDTTFRSWEDEEVLMVKTASDQLSVAISHARLFRQVQNQAITDALTGLHNHRYFQQCLERETELADRNKDQVSLILLDLDHLKRVNDTYGHRSGDAVLCHVAAMMKSVVRKIDVCARYGGEEFAVLLPQCPSESAVEVAKRLGYSIASKPVPIVGQVTASIGVATYPSDARNKDELIEIADRAMYLAKSAGRNCIRTSTHAGHMGTDVR